jgi:hypothetical protein
MLHAGPISNVPVPQHPFHTFTNPENINYISLIVY